MHRKMMCVATLSTSLTICDACNSMLPPPAAPTPAAPQPSPPTELAGTYALTVAADSMCVDLPQDVKKRTYSTMLAVTPNPYLAISVVGGGFTKPIGIGDLWSDSRINWNNFDVVNFECYGGYKEPLGPSRSLTICGTGNAQAAGTTITANISGEILVEWVEPDPFGVGEMQRWSRCAGTHKFTFQRSASNSSRIAQERSTP